MKEIVENLIGKKVISCSELIGGFSFETWLVEIENEKKIIFRTAEETEVPNGKKFVPLDIFKKEENFYNLVNELYPNRCPKILSIEKRDNEKAFQIMSYIEGEPLDKYITKIDKFKRKEILKDIGRIVAEINNIKPSIKLDKSTSNISWKELFCTLLNERLNPLLRDALVSSDEVDRLNHTLENHKLENSKSLLHLDMRLPNLIYKDGVIHVIDSENCLMGDPLYEIAIISVAGLLTDDFIEGYKIATEYSLDLKSVLFELYKLEREAALVNLFKNILNDEERFENSYAAFTKTKEKILTRTI